MADAATLSVLLRLRDEASAGLRGARQRLQGMGRSAGEAGRALGMMAAPIAVVGALGVRSFKNFEESMVRAGAVANASEDQLKQMMDTAREMGRTTRFTATESAEALTFLAMAGLGVEKSIGALPSVLQLASSSGVSLAESANIVTNVMAGMQLGIEDLGRANDVLVTAFTSANTNLEQLGQAFKFAGPVASTAGIEFEETAAALALMGNSGIQASMAGTGLRGAITRLLNPSGEASKVLERLGVTAVDATGKLLPLRDIIGQFESVGLTAGDAMEIFGQRAGPAMLALIQEGSGALTELTQKMLESGGTAKRVEQAQLATFAGQMDVLAAGIESVAIEIGRVLVPALISIANFLKPVLLSIGRWIEANPTLTKAIFFTTAAIAALSVALIAMGIILPAIAVGLGIMATAASSAGTAFLYLWSAAFGPVGLAIAAIASLVAAFFIFRDQMPGVFEAVGKALSTFVNFFVDGINLVIRGLNRLPKVSIQELGRVSFEWRGAGEAVKRAGDVVIATISRLIPSFGEAADESEKLTDAMAPLARLFETTAAASEIATDAMQRQTETIVDMVPAYTNLTIGQKMRLETLQQEIAAQNEVNAAFARSREVITTFVAEGMDPASVAMLAYSSNVNTSMDAMFAFRAEFGMLKDIIGGADVGGLAPMHEAMNQIAIGAEWAANAINDVSAAISDIPSIEEGLASRGLSGFLGGIDAEELARRRSVGGTAGTEATQRIIAQYQQAAASGTLGTFLAGLSRQQVNFLRGIGMDVSGGRDVIPPFRADAPPTSTNVVNVQFSGNVYGLEDLNEVILSSVRDGVARGGFSDLPWE